MDQQQASQLNVQPMLDPSTGKILINEGGKLVFRDMDNDVLVNVDYEMVKDLEALADVMPPDPAKKTDKVPVVVLPNVNPTSKCGDSPSTSASVSDFCWTRQSTALLIDVRIGRDDEFQRPRCKKTALWKSIADQLSSNGYAVTGQACDDKFRSLMSTYRRNKRNKGKTGTEGGKITWEFYETLDRKFGCKASVIAPEEHLGSTLNPETLISSEDRNEDGLEDATDDVDDPDIPSTSSRRRPDKNESDKKGKKRKKSPEQLSVKRFLWKKMELEERKFAAKEERERKRLELKEKALQRAVFFNSAISDEKSNEKSASEEDPGNKS